MKRKHNLSILKTLLVISASLMNSDDSQRYRRTQQLMPQVRILRKEPQLQFPKKPQLQLLLRLGKEPQLQNPCGIGKTVVLMHLRDQEDTGVDCSLRTLICLIPPFG